MNGRGRTGHMFAWTLTAPRLEDTWRTPRLGKAALTTEAEKVRADMVLCVRE